VVETRISLLGQVAVTGRAGVIEEADFGGRQIRLLFAYLVAEHGRRVTRDALADALWGTELPATWEKALTVIVSKVRSLLTAAGVDATVSGAYGCYRLDVPQATLVDTEVATDAGACAEAALRSGDLVAARSSAEQAARLLRMPFLAGEDGAWVDEKRRDLAGVRVRALEVLAGACLAAGDATEAAEWAEQTVALEPFRESGYRKLMEAQFAAGNRAEALGVYDRCRRLLAEELGASPSPATEVIYRRLLEEPGSAVEDGVKPAATPRGRAPRRRRGMVACLGIAATGAVVIGVLAFDSRASAPTVVPNSLVRVDPHTLRVTRVVPVGDAPDLVVSSAGYLWVTHHVLRGVDSGALRNAGDRTLSRVDPSNGDVVVVGGGLAPCGLAAAPSGGVWVANCYPQAVGSGDNVIRVDARTLQFRETWPVTGGEGFYRGLTYGDGSLWVSEIAGGDLSNLNAVTRIDPITGRQRVYPLARAASDLTWSPVAHDLWIGNFGDGSVTTLRPETSVVDVVDDVTAEPSFSAMRGGAIWVSDWSSPQVVRIGTKPRTPPRRIALAVHTDSGVWGIAAGAGAIWATTPRDGALWHIDPTTKKVTRIDLGYAPVGVAVDASGVWVSVRRS
jgi:SARP family transcriptional regulator, regulator of embCAB operon